MQYAIVCFPEIQSHKLHEFRKKFDPKSSLILPHITLVFPVSSEVGKASLIRHAKKVITQIQSFSITLEGTYLADDNYLYLLVSKGCERIIEIHNNLYTGVLAPYLRKEIKYIPHLTIGYFEKNQLFDEVQYHLAMKELESSPFKFEVVFNNLSVIQIDDMLEERKVIKNFNL